MTPDKQIRKFSIWENPTQLDKVKGPHWDGYIWYKDGTTKALYSLDRDQAHQIFDQLGI